ncbi:hypothetical protein ABW19_dt0206417 [Dactylella cylindrospora]|nr:hypothetical protein ABW19_dt0206417 [Dactylella cylindrospora]
MNESSAGIALASACPPNTDASFGPIVQGCRDNFDFTFAFEQYFFSIAPSTLFLILGSVRLAVLNKREAIVSGGLLRLIKLGTIGAFAVLQLSLLIIWSTVSGVAAIRQQAVAGAALSFAGAVLFPALSPSWIINAYLFFTILFDVAILRTLYLSPFPLGVRIISSLTIAIKCILLGLEAGGKQRLQKDKSNDRTPEAYAGPFSQGLFWWLNGLIRNGFKNVLKVEDMLKVEQDMETEILISKFWRIWNNSSYQGKHKLGVVLLRLLRFPLILAIIPRFILIGFIFCQPLLLERFLKYLRDPMEKKDVNTGKAMIGAYAVVYVGMAVTSAFYWYRALRCITMMRSALIAAIYTKTTEISITALNNAESVTLMSGDVENLIRGLKEIHELWAAIIQIAIATWLLARQLGYACVGPIIVCVVAAFVMGATSGLAKKYLLIWMDGLQKRTGITSSTMGSLKGIKMLGLTRKVAKLVQTLRVDEVTASKKFRVLAAYTSTLAYVPLMISPIVTFAIYTGVAARGNTTLDSTRLFTSLSLLILITQPLFGVFKDIFQFRSSMGCMDRIEDFLKKDTRGDHRLHSSRLGSRAQVSAPAGLELEDLNFQRAEYLDSGDTILEVQDGNFGWRQSDEPVLRDVNITVNKGDLVMICGPVASGKSTLLKALLGETFNSKGFVRLGTDDIAYCDQTPWLMNASIKSNIAGFSGFDQDLYNEVIHACDLQPDLVALPKGDRTPVGSKGVTLSGGQKQRVALARALYARKQLIILDDIFSGLDPHTQSRVFQRVLGKQGLFRKSNATIILATHAVNLLQYADKVIALEAKGEIIEQCSFREAMQNQDGYIKSLVKEFDGTHEEDRPQGDSTSASSFEPEKPQISDDVTEDAARQSGDRTLYTYLFSKIGWKLTSAFLFLEVLWAFFTAFPTVWLKWWSDANEKTPNANAGLYIGVYAVLQISGLISWGLLTWCCFDVMARKSGIKLHSVILDAVMYAPMSLISKTDIGSIVNRFTQDLSLIDRSLPLAIMCCASNLLVAAAQAVLISTASPYIAISFPCLIVVFYIVQKYYLRTSRQLRLLDLESKAPVYTLFLESLEGLSTIRAFGWQKPCISKNYDLVDTAQRPFYLLAIIQKWLTLVLDLLTAVLAVIVVSVAVITRESVSVGFTGVALTQIISFTGYLTTFMRFWTQLETSLGAISRIRQFSRDTPNEDLPSGHGDFPGEWPSQGRIEIENLSAGYDDTLALKGVDISIAAGEKVGICGRTGGVDKETDDMMQDIIRQELMGKTIIAVAHRLNTILDFDKVAVIEDGKVSEYDAPSTLLARESKFKKLFESAK